MLVWNRKSERRRRESPAALGSLGEALKSGLKVFIKKTGKAENGHRRLAGARRPLDRMYSRAR